jgi:hypothetical protein
MGMSLRHITDHLPRGLPNGTTRHRLVDGIIGAGAALVAGAALQRRGLLPTAQATPASQADGGKPKGKKAKRQGAKKA